MRTKFSRKKNREAKKLFAIEYLGGKCVSCGTDKNLEFDHIIPGSQKYRIAVMYEWSAKRIIEELNKCQLLCKSCHLIKTINERGDNEAEHGTTGMYSNHDCRCKNCKKAWSSYYKIYKSKRREALV